MLNHLYPHFVNDFPFHQFASSAQYHHTPKKKPTLHLPCIKLGQAVSVLRTWVQHSQSAIAALLTQLDSCPLSVCADGVHSMVDGESIDKLFDFLGRFAS